MKCRVQMECLESMMFEVLTRNCIGLLQATQECQQISPPPPSNDYDAANTSFNKARLVALDAEQSDMGEHEEVCQELLSSPKVRAQPLVDLCWVFC